MANEQTSKPLKENDPNLVPPADPDTQPVEEERTEEPPAEEAAVSQPASEPVATEVPAAEPPEMKGEPVEPPSEEAAVSRPASEPVAVEPPAEELFVPNAEPEEPPPEGEVVIDIDQLEREDEYTPDDRAEWESRYAETMKVFSAGELVKGKVIAINESDVTVDIGFKSEGNIPLEEFDDPESLKVGDEIEVCIDRIEDSEGTLVLSKRKAEFYRVWEKINELYRTGEMVEAQIIKRIKGGMVVDLFGVEAFLPGSQIDVHPVRDFDALVGVTMDFRIIKVNNARKNVVLSHKVLVEESLREIREKVLAELEEGQVVEGTVKNITDFGVFVDLGGVDGLLHITDLSWGRVSHPSDVVALDEKIKVKVLHYDRERQRISLGLKQLKEHHWEEIEKKYPVGEKFKGRVVSIVRYGAFVELEPGVEGLVHISEMSWTQHLKHPSQLVNVGDEIEVVILNIDRENFKISLGMKQVEEDPWERLERVLLPGTRHKGIVRDLVPFGAFVELEPGIDGLIHISDLSWTRKVRHPGEIVKKGEEIEVVILNFDKNERRIALGYKQLVDDPWDDFEREYPIRARTEGSVIRVLEKGIVVMLPLGVEGFVPNSQLGRSLAGENKKKVKEGDNIELEVIEFDKGNHRIVLSHSIVERSKERTVYRSYKEYTGRQKATIGDLLEDTGQVLTEKGELQKPKARKGKRAEKPAEASAPAETEAAEGAPTTEVIEPEPEKEAGPEAEAVSTETAPSDKVEPSTEPESVVSTEPAESEVKIGERETTPSPKEQPETLEPEVGEPETTGEVVKTDETEAVVPEAPEVAETKDDTADASPAEPEPPAATGDTAESPAEEKAEIASEPPEPAVETTSSGETADQPPSEETKEPESGS